MVEAGDFRRDLFQRLAGIVIRIPPLRERPGDVAEIGMSFVAGAAPEVSGKALGAIERWLRSAEARGYAWPGNVRELQNVLRNLLLGLPPGLRGAAPAAAPADLPAAIRDGVAPLEQVEHWYLRRVFTQHDGNHAAASRSLGIDRSTLKRRLAGAGVRGPAGG